MSCEWHKRVRWLRICRKNRKVRQMYIERLQETAEAYGRYDWTMEEDKNLRCSKSVGSSEGHYDPAGPDGGDEAGVPDCAGCGMPKSTHRRECGGCGFIEAELERMHYKGPLYKDTINDEPYCIRCSRSFYEMDNLPDGVVLEEGQ